MTIFNNQNYRATFKPISTHDRLKALQRLHSLLKEISISAIEMHPNMTPINGGLYGNEKKRLLELSQQIDSFKFETLGRITKIKEALDLEEEESEAVECKPRKHNFVSLPYKKTKECTICGKVKKV